MIVRTAVHAALKTYCPPYDVFMASLGKGADVQTTLKETGEFLVPFQATMKIIEDNYVKDELEKTLV